MLGLTEVPLLNHVSSHARTDEEAQRPTGAVPVVYRDGTNRLMVNGYRVRYLGYGIVGVVLFFLLGYLLFIHAPISAIMFRAATPVPERDMFMLQASMMPRFRDYVKDKGSLRGTPCGVAAPTLRVYRQYMMMNIQGKWVDFFNPQIKVAAGPEANVTLVEDWFMCKIDPRHQVSRAITIEAQWDTVSGGHELHTLYDGDAFCLQQFVDVFNGVWPCDAAQEPIPYIPAYKDL